MVVIKNVKEALQQRVWSVNENRKPRHIDNGLSALSHINRTIDNLTSPQWVTTDFLRKILEDQFYKSQPLGPLFLRNFNRMLPQLEEASMIEFNGHGRGSYRITREMARLLVKIDDAMISMNDENSGRFKEGMKLHNAHCDYIRQKISKFRPTLKAAMKEVEELQHSNRQLRGKWDQHARACHLAMEQYPFSRDGSVFSDVTFVRSPSTGPQNHVFMDMDEQPVAGSSLSVEGPTTTPLRHRSPSSSVGAYPTPESLPRSREHTIYPSTLPSPLHDQIFLYDPDVTLTDDMDIDDIAFSGFSSRSSTDVEDDLPPPKDLTAKFRQLEADLEHVAQLVGAEEPTYQAIEKAYQTTADQSFATELEMSNAREELEVFLELCAEQTEIISNLDKKCEDLEKSETAACALKDSAEAKYARLKAAVEEEDARNLQRLMESRQRLQPL